MKKKKKRVKLPNLKLFMFRAWRDIVGPTCPLCKIRWKYQRWCFWQSRNEWWLKKERKHNVACSERCVKKAEKAGWQRVEKRGARINLESATRIIALQSRTRRRSPRTSER